MSDSVIRFAPKAKLPQVEIEPGLVVEFSAQPAWGLIVEAQRLQDGLRDLVGGTVEQVDEHDRNVRDVFEAALSEGGRKQWLKIVKERHGWVPIASSTMLQVLLMHDLWDKWFPGIVDRLAAQRKAALEQAAGEPEDVELGDDEEASKDEAIEPGESTG